MTTYLNGLETMSDSTAQKDELPYIEGRPLCKSFNAKLRMVSLEDLHNDEVAHDEYRNLYRAIDYRLGNLKENIYSTPEAFIADIRAFETDMEKINLLRRLHKLTECTANNLTDYGDFYKHRKEIPSWFWWTLRSNIVGRFHGEDDVVRVVLKDGLVIKEEEAYATEILKSHLQMYLDAMNSVREGHDRFLTDCAKDRSTLAKARCDELITKICPPEPELEFEGPTEDPEGTLGQRIDLIRGTYGGGML